VGIHNKTEATHSVKDALANFSQATLSRIAIRINSLESAYWEEDLLLCVELNIRGLVVPKLTDPEAVAVVRHSVSMTGRADALIFAGIESLAGVRDCFSLLSTGLNGVYFGAEDFIEDIGGHRTDDGLEVLYARSQVVLAAKLAGITAIDQAVTAVHDLDRFHADAALGRSLGYTGKICLHPGQALASNEVFAPSPTEVERAERIVASSETGVQLLDGKMVDAVHLRAATRLLARHRQIDAGLQSP
jgi:citrate lyase subunit beta/citryl-CoA lyase